MRRCLLLAAIAALQALLLTGCWSSAPIEDVNMEVAVALDAAEETKIEESFAGAGGVYPKRNKLSCTYQFIVPQGSVGSKKEGASSRSYYNMTESGDSVFESVRELALRTNRPPIGHHLKVIIIGEKLARNVQMSELIDFFSRDNDIRPSVLILVSKGEARDVLNNALPGQTPAFVMEGLFANRDRNLRIWEPLSIAKAVGPLHGRTSFLVQNVIAAENEVKFAGAGLIKGETGTLTGFLNEMELGGVVWLTGKGRGGVLKTYAQEEGGRLITYEVKSMDSTIEAQVQGGEISFHVQIESTGRYAETFNTNGSALKSDFIKRDEQLLEKQVQANAKKALAAMQDRLQADAAGFGKALQIQHPQVWRKVKDHWDEVFSTVPVTVEAKLTLEDFGASGTSSE
ncbi:Ger(x)C family spore germination protein ['Paenibacillus yunnanensis' Narsing Rao et al. 2020]|uniref:Ger(x)C family spore germination protein n=1 Tax=Paenibacillus tengchongensis TaxID=2608684 RepID=UPI00124C43F5|nr:Ger(x)C family spore germination protein [Paenibacillus tengchongensis]